MSEQTNGPHGVDDRDGQGTPTFVGGAFGVTSSELQDDAADDPVAAFREVEDAEDTGPDVLAGADVPETVQDDVSHAQDAGTTSDVEGTGTEPSPGERNEPV